MGSTTRWLLAVFLATSYLPLAPAMAGENARIDSRTIIFGSDHNFPPYEYLDSDGTPRGFNVDLINAIGEAMGLRVEVQLGPWAEVRKRLEEEGSIDVSDMFHSTRREALVDFSEPFAIMHDQFYARRGARVECALGKLDGKEVLVEEASFTHEQLELDAKGATLIAVESEPAALRLLAAGRHDCALVTQTVGQESIRRFKLTNLAPVGPPVYPREYGLVVAKGNHALLEQLNQGLAIIRATGKFSEIYDKWFGQSRKETLSAQSILKYATWVLLPTLVLVSIVLLWTWSLRRQVAQRTSDLQAELLERKRAEAELDYMATHDALTGLPNRQILYARMGKWTGEDRQAFALLLLDLDRFKEVNDTLGHQAGDNLLKQVGERLLGLLHDDDLLVRMGGDEFAILRHTTCDSNASAFARRLLDALDTAFEIAGIRLQVGASVGVACHPEHGSDASTLIRRADVAMYISKQELCGLTIYDPGRDKHNPERLALMGDIKNAIILQQLVLHYQPKIRLDDRSVIGVEALVRWNHPERGVIFPDDFIPFVEMSDQIRPFTLLIIDTAMAQWREWKARGIDTAVAVNISARNLLDHALAADIRRVLADHEADASRLELEITETAIMADPVRSRETLRELAALGVRISIDDFGIGYSSLSYLQKLPVNSLKIDRSFVTGMLRDLGAREIVSSVIALAHNLDLAVIAEGVEDENTEYALNQLGCDIVQGYFYGRPQPAEAVEHVLAPPRTPNAG